nr:unnamed protein product [Callosobruchus analis]CAI5833480.1 unnamed protein product [Callosobruchus analis]
MKQEINGDHVTYKTGKQIRALELGTEVAYYRTANTSDIRHEPENLPDIPILNTNPNIASSTSPNNTELLETEPLQTPKNEPGQPNIEDVPPVIRRSSRVRKAPMRLDL